MCGLALRTRFECFEPFFDRQALGESLRATFGVVTKLSFVTRRTLRFFLTTSKKVFLLLGIPSATRFFRRLREPSGKERVESCLQFQAEN